MDPLKILWLGHRDLEAPNAGGAERSAREIARGLALRGHRVLSVSGGNSSRPARDKVDGVELRRTRGAVAPHFVAWEELRAFRPDVVVEDLAHVLPWGTAWLRRAPVVAYFRHMHARTLHGQVSGVIGWPLSWIERHYRTLLGAPAIVTESDSARSDLRSLGMPDEAIQLIPPGVDCNRFHPGDRASTPEIVYFGGLRPYKRPEHLIRLVARLRSHGSAVTATIIGDGPTLGPIRRESRALGIEGSIRFAGRLQDDTIPTVVARAWVNVHCSVSEGWCLSAMEAAAAGVPTVGYRVPGLRDSVLDGVSGILVDDGDLSALERATAEVLASPNAWWARSRQRAQEFGWDRCVDAWDRLLRGIGTPG